MSVTSDVEHHDRMGTSQFSPASQNRLGYLVGQYLQEQSNNDTHREDGASTAPPSGSLPQQQQQPHRQPVVRNQSRTSSASSSASGSEDRERFPVICALCYLLLTLLCLTDMKTRTRVLLLWCYLTVGAICAGTLIRYKYNQFDISLSESDMRPIDDISNTYCDAVDVTSTARFTGKLLHERPQISYLNDTVKQYRKCFKPFTLPPLKYSYWSMYLLEGTEIDIYVCAYRSHVFLVQGSDAFAEWDAKQDCESACPHIENENQYPCRNSRKTFKYKVTDTDVYYVLVSNGDVSPDNVVVEFDVSRTTYNLFGEKVCEGETECFVDLPMSDTATVVLLAPSDIGYDNPVTVRCSPRMSMYVLVFGILPVLSGTILTYVILKCQGKCNQNPRVNARRLTGGRSDSEIFVVPHSSDVMGISNPGLEPEAALPSYSDVMPPSYEEVLEMDRRNKQK